jgi:putative tricarboxylic transport membrane protein
MGGHMHADRAYRTLALGALAAAALVLSAGHAAAANWKPEQNVEIVVPTSPGTGSDATGRFVQKLLTERKLVAVPAAVVNKPGGAATLGITYLNQHPGNGHYLMVANPALLTSFITGASKMKYTEVTPLGQIGRESVVFAVRADSSLKNARDLADRLKADPSGIRVAFANALGNQNHIAVAQVAKSVGASARNLKVVVFNGSGEALAALLGGHVDLVTISASPVLGHVAAGKLRILAVTAEQRLGGELAAVPTWRELGISALSSNWRTLVGPRGMTDDQIRYWDEVIAKLAQLPEWKLDLEGKLVENTYFNARDTRKLMDAEHAELTAILSELGLAR